MFSVLGGSCLQKFPSGVFLMTPNLFLKLGTLQTETTNLKNQAFRKLFVLFTRGWLCSRHISHHTFTHTTLPAFPSISNFSPIALHAFLFKYLFIILACFVIHTRIFFPPPRQYFRILSSMTILKFTSFTIFTVLCFVVNSHR